MHLEIAGLEEHIAASVAAEVARVLGARQVEDKWMDSAESAEYLGVAVTTVHDLVSAGRLPRYGERKTKIRLRRSDLDAYVGERR